MKTFLIFQKYQSVRRARLNKKLDKQVYIGCVEEQTAVKAIKKASQQFSIHAILLEASMED